MPKYAKKMTFSPKRLTEETQTRSSGVQKFSSCGSQKADEMTALCERNSELQTPNPEPTVNGER
jgi:hypothetical protein